ncbi:MAG: anti-sigma regulatory factor [Actinomycetota bacterium]|nr:anti-sigma regulatory factor [Actinomycetota bacterium]
MDHVELEVPARPEFLHLIRSVVASIGARKDLSYDDIDDLQIAIDEAGGYLLQIASQDSIFKLNVGSTSAKVTATLTTTSPRGVWPPAMGENSLAWKVLAGLTDEAEFLQGEEGPGIRLSKAVEGKVPSSG